MEDWDDARFFLAVCRAGSFTGAARRLGVKQSTVSRRVAALEAALGHQLFERSGPSLTLTTLGQAMLPHAQAQEAQAQAMRELAQQEGAGVAGLVRLATTSTLATWAVTPRLAPLLAKHEALRVEVLTGDRSLDLARREADLALRFVRPSAGELVTARVGTLPTCVMAREDVIRRALQGGEGLESLTWLVFSADVPYSPEDAWVRQHVSASPRLLTNDLHVQVEWARLGLGAAVLPRALTSVFPELRPWPLEVEALPTLELILAAPRSLHKLPRVRAVWELLAALGEELSAL